MLAGQLPRSQLVKLVLSRFLPFLVIMPLVFFLPAGTLDYWQAWLYMGTMTFLMISTMTYLLIRDPALLERRMRLKEKKVGQKWYVAISLVFFLLAFLLPGFDRRYGWSQASTTVVLAAELLMIAGYGLFVLVMRENSYASRVIEVEQGQKVISSGPYSVVRHPMYVAVILIYSVSPLVLGSWLALIPAVMIIPTIIARILGEEKVLRVELPGYVEYCRKVKYRLLPGIW